MSTIEVKRLPVEAGISGWEALHPRSTPLRALDTDVTANWLIIGAGFAGLSAARRLMQTRPGEKIVMMDALEVAKGTAGRNSGFMIDVPHNLSSGEYSVSDAASTAQEIAQNRFAIGFAAAAAADFGMSAETFDPSGKINAAATKRGLSLNANYARSLERIGEKYELLDAAAMRGITGSDYYCGGLYTPGAVMIQPAGYIREFARGLGEAVQIFENSPVVNLRKQDGLWKAQSTRGSVSAPKVIVAVNGHIESFGFFSRRLMHIFTYAAMTAAFSDKAVGAPRWAILPADPMGATLRKITTNGQSRIVVRTRFTYDPGMEISQKRLSDIAAEQQKSLIARFPNLAHVPMDYSWAGRLCLSRNHTPAFGELDENLYSACCENGLGTVKSTLAGVMAVDLATGTPSAMLKDYVNHPQPAKLPPEPLAWLGISSVIRFQELRAGREG